MKSTQINRARTLHAKGFFYGDIAKLCGASVDDIYLAIHGRPRPQRLKHWKTIEEQVAELIADVPDGRCPNEHRRIVLANFQDAIA